MPQSGKTAGIGVIKGDSSDTGGRIPYPHSGKPIAVCSLYRCKGGLFLDILTGIDNLDRLSAFSGCRYDRGQRVKGIDFLSICGQNNITGLQSGKFCGTNRSRRGFNRRKRCNDCTIGQHFQSEYASAWNDIACFTFDSRYRFYGNDATQHQGVFNCLSGIFAGYTSLHFFRF